jgi:creatinine amidohydrolase
MRLQRCTSSDVASYLKRSTGIIVPIGSTEQHGPNGLLGTDALCAEAIALHAGEALDTLVAPTLSIGNAQHHLGFPGGLSLRPSTMIALIRDVVESLAHHGLRHFYFLNGHGGNIAPVEAAFSEVYAAVTYGRLRPVRCALRNCWEGERFAALVRELYGDAEGSHATCSEISLTWHLYPESRRPQTFGQPGPAESGIYDAQDFRRRYPDGRIGSDPSLCSAEHGAQLLHAAVEDTVEDFRRFIDSLSES